MSRGIDYGRGQTNIDHESGIRYGVIPAGDVCQAWSDASESDYGPASCGECGNEAVEIGEVPFDLDDCKVVRQENWHLFSTGRKYDVLRIPPKYRAECGDEMEWHDRGRDFACLHCAMSFDSDEAYGEEPLGFNLDDGEYIATQGGDDSDVFVIKSPYYTFGPFCSPCAPGAVYLPSAHGKADDGMKSYCFAPDWFEAYDDSAKGEYCGEKTSCPYPVFRVEDNVCVFVPK